MCAARLLPQPYLFRGRKINIISYINPFTAPGCKSSVLKDAGTRLETVYFPHLLSVLCVLMKAFHMSVPLFFLQISHFCWSFSSGIMAVKGLIWLTYNRHYYNYHYFHRYPNSHLRPDPSSDTRAIYQQTAHAIYQPSCPSCSGRAIQKRPSFIPKYWRVFSKK